MQSDRSDNPDIPPVYVARPRPYRARRALWGIGALAMSPDAIPEGPRRKRLVRAATLTSAMGIVWASTASGAPPSKNAPAFDHIGLPSADADEESMRLSSPLPGPWQQMHDTPSSEEVAAPASDTRATSPAAGEQKARKREQASEATARREARPAEDQGETKGTDAKSGKKKDAAVAKGETPDKADNGQKAGKGQKADEKKASAADKPTKAPKAPKAAGSEKASKKGDAALAKGGQSGTQAQGKPAKARAAQASTVSAAPDPDAWRSNVIASHEGVEFVQMSDKTVLVGFHEAAMPGAKPLEAASRPDENHGRGDVSFSKADDPLRTMILPTRARTTNAASAMDVVIPAREAVFAPVTGTVTEVDHYKLYGTHPDNRMVIVPDARPDLRVIILHIEGLKVSPGDKVTAGQTKIAVGANPFTFESQIDRFAQPLMKKKGQATPHVHIELR